jgi:hypothetical protein
MVWFVINILLDVIILIPMAKMSFADYFMSIGLRYIQMPVFTIVTGIVLQQSMNKKS